MYTHACLQYVPFCSDLFYQFLVHFKRSLDFCFIHVIDNALFGRSSTAYLIFSLLNAGWAGVTCSFLSCFMHYKCLLLKERTHCKFSNVVFERFVSSAVNMPSKLLSWSMAFSNWVMPRPWVIPVSLNTHFIISFSTAITNWPAYSLFKLSSVLSNADNLASKVLFCLSNSRHSAFFEMILRVTVRHSVKTWAR